MTDYMLTVNGGTGARDVRVNDAPNILEAIAIAERLTGAPVTHGRGGIGSRFDPAFVIEWENGNLYRMHDREATESMQIVNTAQQNGVYLAKGA